MMQRDEERCEDYCIHLDLVVEILKKVPTKSLVRFRGVSKQWSCIIGSRKDFIDSIITRSLAQHLHKLPLFIFHHSLRRSFFTVSHVYSQSTKHVVSLIPRMLHNSFEWFDYRIRTRIKQEWSKVIFCLPIFPLGILGFGVHKFTVFVIHDHVENTMWL
ncbi:unnamed protein product [Cochlearia groenlandica]